MNPIINESGIHADDDDNQLKGGGGGGGVGAIRYLLIYYQWAHIGPLFGLPTHYCLISTRSTDIGPM